MEYRGSAGRGCGKRSVLQSCTLRHPCASVFALVHIGFGGCTIEWKDSEFGADNVYAWGKEQKGEASHQMFCDWMQRNNLSQDAAATALGISPRTVRRYATAQSSIPRRIWLACLGREAIGGLPADLFLSLSPLKLEDNKAMGVHGAADQKKVLQCLATKRTFEQSLSGGRYKT